MVILYEIMDFRLASERGAAFESPERKVFSAK